MPAFQTVTPCFAVGDIGTTIKWYEKLDFIADPFPAREPFVFCILRRNNIEIMLQRIDGYRKPDIYQLRAGGVWDAYIGVQGVKELYESIKTRLRLVQPLRRQPYGCWEFEVEDPNGYVLVFGEAVES